MLVSSRSSSRPAELAGPLEAEAVVRIFERVIDEARRAERLASERRDGSGSGQDEKRV